MFSSEDHSLSNGFDAMGEDSPDNFVKVEDLPDGSSVYELVNPDEESEDDGSPKDFYRNLAEEMEDSQLSSLAGSLIEEIQQDRESRSDWEQSITKVMKYLGYKVEEFRDVPFMRACSSFDSTLSSAHLRFWSTARAELFPSGGPANTVVEGKKTQEKEEQSERIRIWMNYYLTQFDREYYPDSERLLLYVGFYGCAFRKVYQDPVLNRPVCRFIEPQHFIVNNNSVSLMGSPRITEELFLTKKEVLLRQGSGIYVNTKLPDINDDLDKSVSDKTINNIQGINTDGGDNKSLFRFYEVHAELNIDGIDDDISKDKIPIPYIITICCTTKKVLSVIRNWKEGDETFTKKEYYVQYSYLPGFGIYSLGMAQLAGSNAIAMTAIQRMLIDAGTLKNFPGGLKAKGMKVENNDKAIGPSEYREIETGGMPIQDCIMPMPYQEPSVVLKELLGELKQDTQNLLSSAESAISENNPNAPVGTTLALIEVSSKIQSSVLRSLHVSLGNELKLLYNLFAEHLEKEPYPFSMPGNESVIMGTDFNGNVSVVPVSDPNVTTSAQRILRAEALLKLAQTAPDKHDLREAYSRIYEAMGIQDIDKVLPKPPDPSSLDPISENMIILSSKPITAMIWQDHAAHRISHKKFAAEMQQMQNMAAYATVILHDSEHAAFEALMEMAQQSPQSPEIQQLAQMPAQELLKIPMIQNAIAVKEAQEITQQQQQAAEAAANQPPPIDPNQIMMADIEQHRESAHLKSEESKLRAETEAFKAQLKFEGDKEKMESQREMAIDKNEVDLTIAEMKQT